MRGILKTHERTFAKFKMLIKFCLSQFLLVCLATIQSTLGEIVVSDLHQLEIPKNYLESSQNHHHLTDKAHTVLQQLYSNSIIGEPQLLRKNNQGLHTSHHLADTAHHILNQLNSNKLIEQVPFSQKIKYCKHLLT